MWSRRKAAGPHGGPLCFIHPVCSDRGRTELALHILGPRRRLLSCIVLSKGSGWGEDGLGGSRPSPGLGCHLAADLGQPLAAWASRSFIGRLSFVEWPVGASNLLLSSCTGRGCSCGGVPSFGGIATRRSSGARTQDRGVTFGG